MPNKTKWCLNFYGFNGLAKICQVSAGYAVISHVIVRLIVKHIREKDKFIFLVFTNIFF